MDNSIEFGPHAVYKVRLDIGDTIFIIIILWYVGSEEEGRYYNTGDSSTSSQ
mgnify:CR=1 FL=1